MKNKGFTLIEVLGVIVILSMLVVIGSRSIANILKKSKVELSELQIESIKESAASLANDNLLYMPSINKCKYITLSDLYDYGYFSDEVINPEKNEAYTNIFVSVCAITNDTLNTVSYNYQLKYLDENEKVEFGMNPFFLAEPDLYNNNLTPIVYIQLKYASSTSDEVLERNIVVNDITEENGYYYKYEWQVPYEDDVWYDYDNQMWANAVILDNGIIKSSGDTVDVDLTDGTSDAIGMFVWIPRYSYTIKCQNNDYTNCYGNYDFAEKIGASSNVSSSTPGAIDIKFVSANVKSKGSAKYYGSKPKNWYTMSAFTLQDNDRSTELDGLWIGKFEVSAYDKINEDTVSEYISCSENCSESSMIRTLPNLSTLLYNSQFTYFNLINGVTKNYNLNNLDTHMIKNSEWSLGSYLYQSLYGKYGNYNYTNNYKNIYRNISSTFITGSSNGGSSYCYNNDSVSITRNNDTYNSCLTQLGYDYLVDNNDGKGPLGAGASTSGSIYGIYDMEGGALEFSMFNANNYPAQSQFTFLALSELSLKYIDKYDIDSKKCNGEECLGQGFDTFYRNVNLDESHPFLLRGGYNGLNNNSIFTIGYSSGPGSTGGHRNSTRIAIFKAF